jgi:hypothetical protein
MSAVTQWFRDVQPSHIGVYQTEQLGEIYFAFWRGRDWSWFTTSPQRVMEKYSRDLSRSHARLTWRGLAEKPEAE